MGTRLDWIREYDVLGASAIETSGEGGRRRRQRRWRVCVKIASSGSATCVAVRLSIIGTSRQDERSMDQRRRRAAEAAETVAYVRHCASSGSATCVAVR